MTDERNLATLMSLQGRGWRGVEGDGIYKGSLETGRGLDIKGQPSDKLFLLSSPQAARPLEALGA